MNPDNPAPKAALLALVAAAGIAMLACTEAARPAAVAPADAGSGGGGATERAAADLAAGREPLEDQRGSLRR